jgi:hypothetical protein
MFARASLRAHAMRKTVGIALVAAALMGGGVLMARAEDQAREKVLGVWEAVSRSAPRRRP